MKKLSPLEVVVASVVLLLLCGMLYVFWFGTFGPGKHVMTPMERARNADTSNFDTVLRF
jgi:hypothetical protein